MTRVATHSGGKPTAIIYAHTILSRSMTFIRSHADALQAYDYVYAGAHRASDSLDLGDRPVYVANDRPLLGILDEYRFRSNGRAPRLYRQLRSESPAIVHAHFGTSGPTGLAIAEHLDVPLLVTFHGADATISDLTAARSRRGRELINGKARLIARAGCFIAVSNYIRDKMVAQGYPEAKIVVHRNGIDIGAFTPQPAERESNVVLFIGRFVEKKGVANLVAAARRLRRDGVPLKLVLVGDGPLREPLARDCVRAGIEHEFTGFLTIDQVRQWLKRAAVVAVPSVTAADGDSEGLPTVLLEAQAMATPVVGTIHSGIPEGVVAGETAELVAEHDNVALANALASFLQSADKVERFGAAGRDFVCQNFALDKQVRGLEQIYTQLIERHAAGSAA